MNTEEHIEKHKELHKNLDELAADYLDHTNNLLSESSIMDLMKWSYEQTLEPTESN